MSHPEDDSITAHAENIGESVELSDVPETEQSDVIVQITTEFMGDGPSL
jgi:quinolinate synthase